MIWVYDTNFWAIEADNVLRWPNLYVITVVVTIQNKPMNFDKTLEKIWAKTAKRRQGEVRL